MVKVISAKDPLAATMDEEESKDFLENKDLLIHIGTVDNKRESNLTPVAYYFDNSPNKIHILTHKNSREVRNISNRKIISHGIMIKLYNSFFLDV
jgi:hypothetical protein